MPAGMSTLAPMPAINSEKPAFTVIERSALGNISLPILRIDKDGSDCESINTTRTTLTVYSENVDDGRVRSRRRLCRSNEHLFMSNLQSYRTNPITAKLSKSEGSLKEEEKCSEHSGKSSLPVSTEDFNRVLSAKLKKIQEQEEEAEESRLNLERSHHVVHPKPFITTVKTGEFLMPPPEVAVLLGLGCGSEDTNDSNCRSRFRHMMSLNRRAQIRRPSRHDGAHVARCPLALKATEDFSSPYCPTSTNDSSVVECTMRIGKSNCAQQTVQPAFHGSSTYDRRIIRGSTYASASSLIDAEQTAKQAESRRRQLTRKRVVQSQRNSRFNSPPPIPGRKHEPVQTEAFLEELFEKVEESSSATQTDCYVERPDTPPPFPVTSTKDACTQIDPDELFNYDEQVEPILQVLVGKTIEQALIEVLEEEEIAGLKEQQQRFVELRNSERAERQRLEEEDRRLREEKDRQLKRDEQALRLDKETKDRVETTALLSSYMSELVPAVLENLKISGYLMDGIGAEIEDNFMPWLMAEVKREMKTMVQSRELLIEIIKEIVQNRAEIYNKRHVEQNSTESAKLVEGEESVARDGERAGASPTMSDSSQN